MTRLTRSQEGVVHAQLASDLPARYTVGELVELSGPVDVPVLARAVATAVGEAEVHRLRVDSDGAPGTGPLGLEPADLVAGLVDLTDADDPLGAALAWARGRIGVGLPFGDGPLHDHRLLRLGPHRFAWFATSHHVLLDGYAVVLVVRRALEIYGATAEGHAVPACRFTSPADVAAAERDYEASPAHARDRAHWSEVERRARDAGAVRGLVGLVGPTGPGTGTVRLRGAFHATPAAVTGAADRLGVAWPTLVAAAHAVALARLARARDVVVGVPLMNRMGVAALAPVSVVNVLPLAVTVRPSEPLGLLLDRVDTGLRDLRRHGRFRYEELARLSGRVGSTEALVGAELNLKLFDQPDRVGALGVRLHNLSEGPVDDVGLSVYREAGALRWEATAPGSGPGSATAARALAETVEETLRVLVDADVSTPVGLLAPASTGSTRSPVPAAPPAPVPALAGRLLHELAVRHPGRTALVDEGQRTTYGELDRRVSALAAALQDRCGPTTVVTLEIPRGADAVVGLLAGLCAGRAMAPVDPGWPERRRAELRGGLGGGLGRVLVLDRAELARLEARAGLPDARPDPTAPARDAVAYVVHTSGSTGRPKPVAVTQDALAHFLAHHRATTFAAVADQAVRVAQTLPLEFDGCWDTVQAVLLGHELHVLPRAVVQDPAETVRAVHAARLQVLDTTPTVLAALLDEGLLDPGLLKGGHPVRMLSVGGEACPPALWHRLLAEPGLQVANYYGPTETTVDACGVLVAAGAPRSAGTTGPGTGRASIGVPLRGVAAYVLDEHLAPVPTGWVGELYLGGPQVALGYVGQPGSTAARFVANPYGVGERLYRTGDQVSVTPDGSLDYHGRADDQVKVRGYRVEPAEVEAGLRRIAGVRQAAVGARDGRLVAAVVAFPDADLDAAVLRTRAGELLPEHLVPATIALVEALPRTPTGKLDLAALPTAPSTPATGRRPPRTPGELAFAGTVAVTLGVRVSEVDLASNFFALGGDSISAIGVVSRLRRDGWSTSVSQIFTHQTVGLIGRHLVPLDPTTTPAPSGAAPLTGLDASQLDAVHDLVARRRRRPERTP